MKYAVNEQGVAALKRMATVLSNVGEHICDAIGIVKDVADEHDGMLGPHKSSLDDVIENIQITLQKSTTSMEAMSELLEEIAEGYQEIIDDNAFAGLAGGAQSAAGGISGGGMSGNASENSMDSAGSKSITKSEVLANNRIQGRAYEQQEFANFSSQNSNAVEQITIKTDTGVKTRVDAIGIDSEGNIVISEFKSSTTAPLTGNQEAAFPEIMESGGDVVGKGKGIFSGGFQIPAGTKVKIIRPH